MFTFYSTTFLIKLNRLVTFEKKIVMENLNLFENAKTLKKDSF